MLHSTKRFPLIFYSLLLLCFTKSIGQAYNLPAVINPSPQSQAFTRYGDYPMSDYTGLTDISVPIHTVKIESNPSGSFSQKSFSEFCFNR